MTSEADGEIESKSVRARARVGALVTRAGVGVPRVPCWEPGALAMPNLFLAASIFGMAPVQAPPVMVHRMPLEAAPGYQVRYTGRLLNQTHGDIVMALMALAGGAEERATVTLRTCDLERVLERSTGGYNRELLRVLLGDIAAAALYVRSSTDYHYGTLMPFGAQHGDVHTLRINPDMMKLAHGGFTIIDREARQRLARKPLAQWLQLYTAWYDSQGVRSVDLAEVHRVSRSPMERRKLRFRTHEALDAIGEAGVQPWRLGPDDMLRAA
jgi:hypothetical protein